MTAVTFAGSPQTAGALATWTAGFTSSASGPIPEGGVVTVTFHSSFVVPAAPLVSFPTGFVGCSSTMASATNNPTVVSITLPIGCALGASTAATVSIPGVLNPPAGIFANTGFSVRTTSDSATSVSPAAAVTIAGSSVTGVTFSGSPQLPVVASVYSVGFTTTAVGSLGVGDTITVTFNPNFAPPASPVIALGAMFAGCTIGSSTAVGARVSITLASGGCNLPASTPASLTIAGVLNPVAGSYAAATFTVQTDSDVVVASPAAAIVIASTSVSAVTFVGSPTTSGTLATWTVGFTPSASGTLAPGNTVSITFNPAFSFSSPTVVFLNGYSGCTPVAGVVAAAVVSVTLPAGCSLAGNVASTLSISGVTNPAAGTYTGSTFRVSTTGDGPGSPANVVITAGAITTVTMVGAPQTANALATWSIGFTTSAGGALSGISGQSITISFHPSFSVSPTPNFALGPAFTGAGCSSPSTVAVATGSTVTITLGGTCALAASAPASLTLQGITNPPQGTYPATTFSVSTSRDAPASPAAIVIAAPTITALTVVTFSGASQNPAVVTSWTVGFTTSPSGALASGSTISVKFNPNFGLPAAPAIVLGPSFSGCTAGATSSASVVTVTLAGAGCVLFESTPTTLAILGISNPAAPGTYPAVSFGVSTSADTAVVVPAAVVISAAIANVTFVGSPQLPNVSAPWTIGFTPTLGGSLGSGSTITITFNPNFNLPPSPAVSLGFGFTGCLATASASGATAVVSLSGAGCLLPGATPAALVIGGVTNPAAGTYAAATFRVSTSGDTSFASPVNSVVIAGAPLGATITSIDPAGALAGAPSMNLTVHGTGFTTSSIVNWGGSPRLTSFVSPLQLTAVIGAADLATPANISVTVLESGVISNAVAFAIVDGGPTGGGSGGSSILSLTPAAAVAGGPAFTLTVIGLGFVSDSTVRWSGLPRLTIFVSPNELTALVSAADIAQAGSTSVTVSDSRGTSNVATFTILSVAPPSGSGYITYQLGFRWSLIAWVGRDNIEIGGALAGVESPTDDPTTNSVSTVVASVFTWDTPGQRWLAYFPSGTGIPGANDISTLRQGAAYWIAKSGPFACLLDRGSIAEPRRTRGSGRPDGKSARAPGSEWRRSPAWPGQRPTEARLPAVAAACAPRYWWCRTAPPASNCRRLHGRPSHTPPRSRMGCACRTKPSHRCYGGRGS